MRLWLDDIRDPNNYGHIGWTWVKTAEACIAALLTGSVTVVSLDHDLTIEATMGRPSPNEKTGYTVACWMAENNCWPSGGVQIHTLNPSGRAKMKDIIERAGIVPRVLIPT